MYLSIYLSIWWLYVTNFCKMYIQKSAIYFSLDFARECVKVQMPAHQVLPLMAYIFEASYSMSATQAKTI